MYAALSWGVGAHGQVARSRMYWLAEITQLQLLVAEDSDQCISIISSTSGGHFYATAPHCVQQFWNVLQKKEAVTLLARHSVVFFVICQTCCMSWKSNSWIQCKFCQGDFLDAAQILSRRFLTDLFFSLAYCMGYVCRWQADEYFWEWCNSTVLGREDWEIFVPAPTGEAGDHSVAFLANG